MSGLKLKLNTKPSNNAPPPSSIPSTPLATPGGSKLKLKFASKSARSSPAPTLLPASAPPPPPPAVDVPKKTKAGRSSKPSAKILESRKRIKEDTDEEEEIVVNVPNPAKKLKLNVGNLRTGGPPSATPKTPAGGVIIKAKVKGKPPKRIPGEGYDSEASDREIDPHIEEQFILRMEPGEDCDYLRQAIIDKKIGVPKALGGADVYMKFFEGNGRRASISIRGRIYAATLVDLPCIIEGMKSWDRRGWWKSADICQMLLVFAQVKSEDEAKTIPLPEIVDPTTYQYPHGLTAPMYHARKRIFRKRISKTAIEAVEDAVEKLLAADKAAEEHRWEMIDPDRYGSQAFTPRGSDDEQDYSQDEDAEGEDEQDYFTNGHGHEAAPEPEVAVDDDELLAGIYEAFENDEPEDTNVTPASNDNAAASSSAFAAGTPLAEGDEETEADGGAQDELFDDSGDESAEDEDDSVDEAAEEKRQRQEELDLAREDIRDLEAQLAQQQHDLAAQPNRILKNRIEGNIRKIKQELQLKQGAIEGEDGDA